MDQLGSPLPLEPSALVLEEENPLQLPEPAEVNGTYHDPLLIASTADLNPWGQAVNDSPLLLGGPPSPNSHIPSAPDPISTQLSQLISPEPEPNPLPTPQSQAARAWLETLLAQDGLPNLVSPSTPVSIPTPNIGQMETAFLAEALAIATDHLQQWQSNPNFTPQLKTALGDNWQPQATAELLTQRRLPLSTSKNWAMPSMLSSTPAIAPAMKVQSLPPSSRVKT